MLACDVPSSKPYQILDSADDSGDTGGLTAPWATVGGASADALGNEVAAAGDLDGDGQGDVLVAAYLGNRVCVLYGPILAGAASLKERAGLTGDGRDDLLISADGIGTGSVYLLSPATGESLLSAAPVRLDGSADGDIFGYSIGAAAADSAAGADVGAVGVFYGLFAPGVRLADLARYGESYGDSFGAAVDAAPDLLPDGLPGLIIGAPSSDESGGFAGKLYLLSI